MGITKNKTNESFNLGGVHQMRYSNNQEIMILQKMIEELGFIVNNQGDMLRKLSNKLGETLFRLSKSEEQSQLYRIGIRIQKDRLNMFHKTICELGVVDKEIFDIIYSNLEEKTLPITMSGKINAGISLTRYNTSDNLEAPKGSVKV